MVQQTARYTSSKEVVGPGTKATCILRNHGCVGLAVVDSLKVMLITLLSMSYVLPALQVEQARDPIPQAGREGVEID